MSRRIGLLLLLAPLYPNVLLYNNESIVEPWRTTLTVFSPFHASSMLMNQKCSVFFFFLLSRHVRRSDLIAFIYLLQLFSSLFSSLELPHRIRRSSLLSLRSQYHLLNTQRTSYNRPFCLVLCHLTLTNFLPSVPSTSTSRSLKEYSKLPWLATFFSRIIFTFIIQPINIILSRGTDKY